MFMNSTLNLQYVILIQSWEGNLPVSILFQREKRLSSVFCFPFNSPLLQLVTRQATNGTRDSQSFSAVVILLEIIRVGIVSQHAVGRSQTENAFKGMVKYSSYYCIHTWRKYSKEKQCAIINREEEESCCCSQTC